MRKVHEFLADLTTRSLLADYTILKNRDASAEALLPPFQVVARIAPQDMGRPFEEVESIGIWEGLHGAMIQDVDVFKVQVFDEIVLGS